jgi:hypothetical protein
MHQCAKDVGREMFWPEPKTMTLKGIKIIEGGMKPHAFFEVRGFAIARWRGLWM